MDETILFPSPNWFQPSAMAVSTDGWLVYSGPSKSLCVLEPLPQDYNSIVKGQPGYTAHVVNRAHPEKIVCVDICPGWPEKRSVLTGSADGVVKQWSLEKNDTTLKIKSTHSHEIHRHEEVVGVGYCKDGYAVTVGAFGNIVKWDLNSNVAKTFNHVLKNFKATCMACSPHIHMNVAIGTKQGVLLVLDLNGSPRIIYKVRGQENDILKVSWCPQYEVAVRKALKESDKRSTASQRMENLRQEATSPESMKRLDERVKNSQTLEQPTKINEKCEPVVEDSPAPEQLDESGIGKTLPEDSFDCEESVVQEDDMFDIYKDHEADEFGHKKYQPVEILVKVPTENAQEDYLSECEKLKKEILQRKAQSEASIEILVHAMEKAEVGRKPDEQAGSSKSEPPLEGKIIKGEVESSVHIHKHLLATIGKHGSIRIWSKAGKLVGSCVVPSGIQPLTHPKGGRGDKRPPVTGYFTLVWCKPDSLLIADGKSQLLECNPLKIDCKNKLEWNVLHTLHKRGLYVLASSAPRVQTPEMAARSVECEVWSAAQDRGLVRYCLNSARAHSYMTCGGFLYMLHSCSYDARKVAVGVGDGAVRVWESEALEEEESGMGAGHVSAYWHNVQGKVLSVAWHPTRENLLAFATAEARVGLIDTNGRGEKPARVLQPACAGGVYSISWGEGMSLYAAGAGELLLYDASQPDKPPTSVAIGLEGARWEVSSVQWAPAGLVLGSAAGAVAVCAPDHAIKAAVFPFKKIIHTAEWHPMETSSASEPSPYRRLIAVCSLDKSCNIAILEYNDEGESGPSLSVWKWLSGHAGAVLQVTWSPHHDALLLSTSQDATVRVWDVTAGCCVSIFGGHTQTSLGAVWSPQPAAAGVVLSGGADCALRVWDYTRFPADLYHEVKHEVSVDKKKKNRRNNKDRKKADGEDGNDDEEDSKEREGSDEVELEEQAVASLDIKKKYNKKFLLPMIYKQTHPCEVKGIRKLLQKYLEQNGLPVPWSPCDGNEFGIDYIKIFGTINEVNEVLDDESSRLLDTGSVESWVVLCIVRGYIDACVQLAAARNLLDPFLLSIAPCVSFKYWKDATLLYLQQMDRLVAKGEEYKLIESRVYGGAVYRRAAVLLGLHDVRGAVATLQQARLYKEAYVLSRTRYMESLAEETLWLWANHSASSGEYSMAAVCYIALGELSQAAAVLSKSEDEEILRLAADIATTLGQTTFAGHMQRQCHLLQTQKLLDTPETLQPLPTRAQLLLERTIDESDDDVSISDSSSTLKDTTERTNELTATDEVTDSENKDVAQTVDKEAHKDVAHKVDKEVNKDVDQKVDKEETVDVTKADEVQELNAEPDEIAQERNSEAAEETPEAKANSTKELLERLPGMMTTLMKESHRKVPIPNGTHKGDGDSNINAEDITVKVSELDTELQVSSANVG